MTQHPGKTLPQLYLTAPTPCPYLEGRMERKVFTHLIGPGARALNDMLSVSGFRRSQNIAYRPACETCEACVSVRVVVNEFEPKRRFRRILSANTDVIGEVVPATATREQFSLLRLYLDARHFDGGMANMTSLDYAAMVEETTVETHLIEYRLPVPDGGTGQGPLIGVALTDRLGDGLSMVYSFFDPAEARRSLGTYMVLDHIERAGQMGLGYVYLGYWVAGSPKMAYKAMFNPLEGLRTTGWEPLT